jgi:hypothetical protein
MDLPHFLGPVFVICVIAWGIITFLKILTDYFLKKKLIESGSLNGEAVNILKESFPSQSITSKLSSSFSSLKWGLIFLCGGTGLIVLEVLEYDERSTLPFGVVAVSVSIGFLAYYFIVRMKQKTVSE